MRSDAMSNENEEGIFTVDTVPPPEGESDVYHAPTRVGVMAGAIVDELVKQAQLQMEQAAHDDRDPEQLARTEALAAQINAALTPPRVPKTDPLPAAEPSSRAPVVEPSPVATPAPMPTPDPPLPVRFAPPNVEEVASSGALAGSVDDVPMVSPLPAAPIAPPDVTSQPNVAPRPPSRLGTLVLLVLVIALAGVGAVLLRHR
jgi:hypothetical protein